MTKSKRFTGSMGMAIVLVLTLLAGCGSTNKTSTSSAAPQVSEASSTTSADTSTATTSSAAEVTLKILFPGDPPKDLEAVNAAISKKLKADGLNMKLSYTFVPWETYGNKQSLVVAAGEDYDLTWSHISNLSQSVSKNVLMPLDDLLKSSGPGLLKDISDFVWKAVKVDGKIYAIPRVVPVAQSNDTFQIRGDLRKKYGLPEIKSSADFEKYLEAVKTNDPTIVPLVGGAGGLVREIAPSYFANGDFTGSFFYIDVKETPLKVKSLFASDAYEKYVNKTREWYKKGYLPKDPNMFKDVNGDFSKGKMAAMPSNILRPTEVIDALKTNLPQAELEFVQFASDQPKYINTSADNLLSVLSSSKHAKEAVAFVNWVHTSQENYDLFSLGVKDVNYKADGNSASYDGISPDKQYFPISWAWTDLRYNKFSKYITPAQLDVIKNWDKGAVQTPLIGFAINNEPVKAEVAKVQAIASEYSTQGPLMNGIVDFSTVKDKLLSRIKDAGIDTVLAEYQKQLDAFIAAQK
jgi:putative aldouronate transport system substrate-binding protein